MRAFELCILRIKQLLLLALRVRAYTVGSLRRFLILSAHLFTRHPLTM